MARYFFHIHDHGRLIRDEEGTECIDLDGAKAEAKASANDLAQQALRNGDQADSAFVENEDQNGRTLLALSVEEVLAHPGMPAFTPACGESGDLSRPH